MAMSPRNWIHWGWRRSGVSIAPAEASRRRIRCSGRIFRFLLRSRYRNPPSVRRSSRIITRTSGKRFWIVTRGTVWSLCCFDEESVLFWLLLLLICCVWMRFRAVGLHDVCVGWLDRMMIAFLFTCSLFFRWRVWSENGLVVALFL